MTLPSSLNTHFEWVLLGPLGPSIPMHLSSLPLMAVDGGAHFTERMDIWVGDGDSYPNSVEALEVQSHPPEKDESDFTLALRNFEGLRHFKLHLWGFFGGRRDHELFNLGEALSFLSRHKDSEILYYDNTSHGKITYHLFSSGTWKLQHEGLFSIGAIHRTSIRLTGSCKYQIPLRRELPPLSSLGLSNIGFGEFILESMGPIFIYFPEGR